MRSISLVNIGFGNTVAANRIIAVVSPESSPIKRLVQDAREQGRLIDATYGRRTRAVIVCDNSSVVLTSIQPETIAGRITGKNAEYGDTGETDGDAAND
ncbi:MAG: DUF370 domain-containing protein [Defluviitaleaceae bacterium]|nr:DUF370 domain-containing protein [Defluviitaleaceae bacterium]MCL2835678.1 DUF370 domain-containing protein [Defluviitaleaceae bacterium]